MFIVRIFTILFCTLYIPLHAETRVKSTQKEAAIEILAFDLSLAAIAGLVAGGAKIYAQETIRFAQKLPWYRNTSDLIVNSVTAQMISYGATAIAIVLALHGIIKAGEAYNSSPHDQQDKTL